MKAPAFEYMRPRSVGEASAALAASAGDGLLLAGGQSLVPMLNLRLASPSLLIDIGALDELRDITDEGGHVALGARVTHSAIEDGKAGNHWHGLLTRVASDIAYRAVRNRGTVGGSLAHADPAADWPVVLCALGSEIQIAGPTGGRTLPCEDFVLGLFTTALDEGELVTAVRVPKLTAAGRWSYIKVRRKAGAFADALACAVHDPEGGLARVVTGGAATGMRRIGGLEAMLGSLPEDELTTRVEAAVDELAPDIDDYHRRLHVVALVRAISEVSG